MTNLFSDLLKKKSKKVKPIKIKKFNGRLYKIISVGDEIYILPYKEPDFDNLRNPDYGYENEDFQYCTEFGECLTFEEFVLLYFKTWRDAKPLMSLYTFLLGIRADKKIKLLLWTIETHCLIIPEIYASDLVLINNIKWHLEND